MRKASVTLLGVIANSVLMLRLCQRSPGTSQLTWRIRAELEKITDPRELQSQRQ